VRLAVPAARGDAGHGEYLVLEFLLYFAGSEDCSHELHERRKHAGKNKDLQCGCGRPPDSMSFDA
jgi:hypothetical protein